MRKFRIPVLFKWGALALILGTLGACGGSSSSSTPAPTPTPTPPSVLVTPTAEATAAAAVAGGETCSLCHTGTAPVARSGPGHQSSYDELYQDGVIKVTTLVPTLATTTTANDTLVLTFKMTNNGAAFDCTTADTIGSYWVPYTSTANANTFDKTTSLSSSATKAYNSGTGDCTMTKTFTAAADLTTIAGIVANTADGYITVYGYDGLAEAVPAAHMNKAKYPFASILRRGPNTGLAAAAAFTSAANVSGCENCHTQPFLKHAYIYGNPTDLTAGATGQRGFYLCKGCHYTDAASHGGFATEQLITAAKLADATTDAGKALRAHAAAVSAGTESLTTDEHTKYDYKMTLMNDVHMSHAMEFNYPQSMFNCVTCHSGKMGETAANDIFNPANFRGRTCISCHAFEGITAKMSAASYNHATYTTDATTLYAANCTLCHDGSTAPSFKTIHKGGYDPKIYATDGTRYSTTFVATIDSATYDATTHVVDIKFSATGTLGSMKASDINPRVLVGLYGYNTKDFIVSPHSSDSDGKRFLEYVVGGATSNPDRMATVSASGGSWEVTADLSDWASMISDGTVKRIEIAVLPVLKDAAGNTVGLDAPSKTFDLATNAFVNYYSDIVNVARTAFTTSSGYAATKGCNTCHDSLQPHTAYGLVTGGNVKACRLCHVKSSGASHLEMQSRSIDSFVHAIHSFQEFDVKNINFADAFDKLEFETHIGQEFPRFGRGQGATDCESCHVNGMYGVSDQSKSLPALMSASATITGMTRNIGSVPSYVTGPAANACGGCHRAHEMNANSGLGDAGQLTTLFNHWQQNGYLLENQDTLWNATVAKVMAVFK